ncbi:hypothetical protein PYCC9005_002298 [Savitreella phatthalungensis]
MLRHGQKLIRSSCSSQRRLLSVGDSLPKVSVRKASPADEVFISPPATGRSILVGIPAAYSPSCSSSHIPGFISALPQLKKKGVERVDVVAVNDVFVMKAWQATFDGMTDDVSFYADQDGSWTRAAALEFDAAKVLGSKRCKRFAAIIDNGKVAKLFVEPDGTGMTVSTAENVLKEL